MLKPMLTWIAILIVLLGHCPAELSVPAQLATLKNINLPIRHSELKGDLINLLRSISVKFDVPIVGEIAASDNQLITIAAGSSSLRQVLDVLTKQVPACGWQEETGVVHFYNRKLRQAPRNVLNLKLRSFEMPNDVSTLKIALRSRLYSASQGIQNGGGVISDFPSRELGDEKLPDEKMSNVTGREVLVKAAALNRHFSSIIVFPRSQPTDSDINYANRNWFWMSLGSAPTEPLRLQ